ncbi:MAG TPA: ABC transporter permease [Thermohalobaculum sp.]|nr:ABC transporter permease [Thermohalobaculum sp.]
MGVRRFGRVNWIGLWELYAREVRRFANIATQTVMAPVITAVLFMLVFTLAFGERRGEAASAAAGIAFPMFLAPGIVMMQLIQNAFANSSSSLIVAKVQGNIVDTLMPPLSPAELLAGYALGGTTRGLACALATGAVIFPAVGLGLAHPLWALAFAVSGALMLALVGVLAGIYADKFDQMAAITNFVIMPLSFLSGTFYSISVLPEPFLTLSHLNPFFYLIDGFRYGAAGISDAEPALGLAVTMAINLGLACIAWRWLSRGYRLKS